MSHDRKEAYAAHTDRVAETEAHDGANAELFVQRTMEQLHQVRACSKVSPSNENFQDQQKLNANPSASTASSPTPSTSSASPVKAMIITNGSLEDDSVEKNECTSSARPSECREAETSKGQAVDGVAHDPLLDEEIRNRLDKLNAISDLIYSLEVQSDQANAQFRETLRCSAEKLSGIAKNLGRNYIQQGRVYQAAKLSLEQTRADCQRACVQFEQANNDHQQAKLAIREAESKLLEMNTVRRPVTLSATSVDHECDKMAARGSSSSTVDNKDPTADTDATRLANSAKLSEELNQALMRLRDAEERRRRSEKLHSEQANKLIVAQENLTRLEREHGPSIRRAQVYFEEAERLNAKLNTVKNSIARVRQDLIGAKEAYAKALSDLEQFSEDLHLSRRGLIDSDQAENDQ